MSLPAGQQRALDGIAEMFRMTEPRMAAMFAIFTRLANDEPRPRREQLAATGPPNWLIAPWRRVPRRQTTGGRRPWRLMVFVGQLTFAFIVLVALTGLSTHAAAGCRATTRSGVAAAARRQACEAQARAGAYPREYAYAPGK
jgi:hypothetical protein